MYVLSVFCQQKYINRTFFSLPNSGCSKENSTGQFLDLGYGDKIPGFKSYFCDFQTLILGHVN